MASNEWFASLIAKQKKLKNKKIFNNQIKIQKKKKQNKNTTISQLLSNLLTMICNHSSLIKITYFWINSLNNCFYYAVSHK